MDPSTDGHVEAWQCIGCGRIEAPQTCIGVCRDRRIVLVAMEEHARALDEVQHRYVQLDQAQALLGRIAHTQPHDGRWEDAWRAYQSEARALLERWEATDRTRG